MRRLVTGAVVALASCGTGEAPAPHAPSVPVVTASAPVPTTSAAVTPSRPGTPCEAIARRQQEAVEDAKQDDPDELAPRLAGAAAGLPACIPFTRGAWGFVATSVTRTCSAPECKPEDEIWEVLHVSVDLVFADARGKVSARGATTLDNGGMIGTQLTASGFDYDGDGIPEMILGTWQKAHESRPTSEETLWKWDGSTIVPYSPAERHRVATTVDIDDDGRPDLDLGPMYAGDIVPCGMDGIEIDVGPHRVAHSTKSGDFSLDDAAIRAHVRKSCPSRPKRIVPRVKGGIDNDALRLNVARARAWGIGADAIVRELSACKPPPATVDRCEYEKVLPGCVNVVLLKQWAAIEPQVRLDRP
jgi:hypothetical protein